jgi:hypothetical protein
MVKTTYSDMKVYASFDKTQCLLEIGSDIGVLIDTRLENSFDNPIFLQGPTEPLKESTHGEIIKLYNTIKGEKYFVILKEEWS